MLAETTGAPPHFPLSSAVSVGPSDWFGEVTRDEAGESRKDSPISPPPPAAPSEPTLRWKRLGSETLDIEEPVTL